jgi:hypothetical protein
MAPAPCRLPPPKSSHLQEFQTVRCSRGQQRRAQWTVTDRVSGFWCGQRLFTDPGYDWQAWLMAQWGALTFPRTSAGCAPVSTPLLAEAA